MRNNLAVNGVIARLRRDCLQSEELRGELEAHCRQQEREKIIVSKWRKSKSYLATLHSSSNHNQNSRSSGDSNHSNGASSGGNGKGGGTHSKVKSAHHRRKLGTY